MKKFTIALPYVECDVVTAIEAGSIKTMKDMPNGVFYITSGTNGREVPLYFFVKPGKFGITEFNKDFVLDEFAAVLLWAIRQNDVMEDGVGLIDLGDGTRTKSFYEGQVPPLNTNVIEDKDVVVGYYVKSLYDKWLAVAAQKLIINVMEATKAAKRQHASHINFGIEDGADGEMVAGLCLQGPNDCRLRGQMYLGEHSIPDLIDKQSAGMSIVNKLFRGYETHTKGLYLFRGKQAFTVLIDLPFEEMLEWMGEATLVAMINQAIDSSLVRANEVFSN